MYVSELPNPALNYVITASVSGKERSVIGRVSDDNKRILEIDLETAWRQIGEASEQQTLSLSIILKVG